MQKYSAIYIDNNGIKGKKEIYAADVQEVFEHLESSNLTPISVKIANKSVVEYFKGDRVSVSMIEGFITNLASLLSSGINLDKALSLLGKSAETASLKSLVTVIQKDIRSGKSFADTLSAHPEYFDSLVINLVKIGESTGRLDSVLVDLSAQLKFQQKIAAQVKQAAIYPLIIIAVCVLSVMFILTSVVPQLSGMLEQVKELPTYTVVLMSMSDFVRSEIGVISLVGITFLLTVMSLSQASRFVIFRKQIWNFVKSFPIINSMQFLILQLRFSSAMMATLKAGLSLTDAVELSANTLSDDDMTNKLIEIKRKIQTGISLTVAMEEASLYSAMELGFIEVGEETGELTNSFFEITERKGFEFDTKLSALLKLLEPILILIMGVIVGGIVIIMMLSIMSAQDVGL